jgi:hypothetical protein
MMHALSRTYSLPESRPDRLARSSFAPLRADAYLRLRREASGLSVMEVARRITVNARDLPAAVDLVELLEQPGNVARRHETLDRLQSAFAFDPDVYRQLATESADRHPQVCRGCGCSAYDTDDAHAVRFAWASDNACVRCAGEPEQDR